MQFLSPSSGDSDRSCDRLATRPTRPAPQRTFRQSAECIEERWRVHCGDVNSLLRFQTMIDRRSHPGLAGRLRPLATAALLVPFLAGPVRGVDPASNLPRTNGPRLEEHLGRATDGSRLLARLAPGAELPPDLRRNARPLGGRWWRIPVDDSFPQRATLSRLRSSLLAQPAVELVEADVLLHLGGSPLAAAAADVPAPLVANDPRFVEQWHHRAIGAETAWLRATGEGVVVAVIDSGVTPANFGVNGADGFCHPLAGEYDAVTDSEGCNAGADILGHGTFVASVVAECAGNGVGGVGLAPGAQILAIRACTADYECASSDVAAGIDWAVAHGARVINLSLGMACGDEDWPACSTAVENDAIAQAVAAGVSIVAIAGNGGEDHAGFPANHPDVIGVGGLNALLLKTSYSSWGSALSVTAPAGEPGVDQDGDGFEDQILEETLKRVCGAGSGFAYCRWSGTSFAAPHVVAALALLLEAHPGASPDQLRRAIEESALDRGAPGFDPVYAHGAVQAAAALEQLDAIVADEGEGCVPAPHRLCLEDGRFSAEVHWRDYAAVEGDGMAVPMTDDAGLFWFFDAANLEMLVKMVDGCSFNQRFWVYAAATTDVEYELTVTDTVNGLSKSYRNELGAPSPAFTDSSAFACDPLP